MGCLSENANLNLETEKFKLFNNTDKKVPNTHESMTPLNYASLKTFLHAKELMDSTILMLAIESHILNDSPFSLTLPSRFLVTSLEVFRGDVQFVPINLSVPR